MRPSSRHDEGRLVHKINWMCAAAPGVDEGVGVLLLSSVQAASRATSGRTMAKACQGRSNSIQTSLRRMNQGVHGGS